MATNPHAQPYAFPKGKHRELADYLTENTELDPATGCLEWTASLNREGTGVAAGPIAKQYGTRQASRLAWVAHHDRKLDKGEQLARTCGNPKCVHPLHLKTASAAEMWDNPEMPRKRQGSVGALKLGKRVIDAQRVWQVQSLPPLRDPRLGLRHAFSWEVCWPMSPHLPALRHQTERLDIIRTIRRCPIRASRTVLPCGFIRYDLPPGITEIAFTELPPPSYEDVFGWHDEDDDGPEPAPEAAMAIAA